MQRGSAPGIQLMADEATHSVNFTMETNYYFPKHFWKLKHANNFLLLDFILDWIVGFRVEISWKDLLIDACTLQMLK